MATWREKCAGIIESVLKNKGRKREKGLLRMLRAAYPFGSRSGWPYKVWLDEIARQRGKKQRGRARNGIRRDVPGQLKLFEE